MELNDEQKEILDHTVNRAVRNLFCGGSKDMDELCEAGLMEFAGKVGWCPDSYYRITRKGREALEQSEGE